MAINTTPLAEASVYPAQIYGPLPNSDVESADVDNGLEKLGNRTRYLTDTKVAKAGDTMTSTLTITPATSLRALVLNAAANAKAATITGNGTAIAVEIIAGAANSAISATSTDAAPCAEFYNAGNGPGANITGSTSAVIPALIVATTTPSSGAVPRVAVAVSGYLKFTGTDPSVGVDPGANNALHGMTIPKAMALLDTSYAVLDSYNITSVVNVLGSIYRITFVRPMANANYGIKIHVHGAPGYSGTQANATKTTTHFDFVLFKTDTLALGFGAATEAYIEVTGRQ